MGLVCLPTFTIKINLNVGKYTSPMDPMGSLGGMFNFEGCPDMDF